MPLAEHVLSGKARRRVRIALLVVTVAAIMVALSSVAYFTRRAGTPFAHPIQTGSLTRESAAMEKKINLEDSDPPLTLEEIEAFEREINGRLPGDYKRFLLEHNGGVAEPKVGVLWEGDTETLFGFHSLRPASEGSAMRTSLRSLRELNRAKTDGYLPIAGTHSGACVCLAYRGNKVGAVFHTVYEYKTVGLGDLVPIDVTMVPLADSFTEFLQGLVAIPNPYCRIEDLGKRGTADDLAQYLAEGNSIDTVGKNGLTIVCEAVKFDNSAMIRTCVEHGASLSGTIESAVGNRHVHLIKMLVDAGADINECNEFGDTPLHYVVGTALPGEGGARNRELRDLLVKLGAIDPYRWVEDLGERGTPDDLARYLAEGNSIDAPGKERGRTIVCEAVEFNNVPMVRGCIERGASLSGTIHIAVENGRTELIEMLVRAGADVNERDEFGCRPLTLVPSAPVRGKRGARNRQVRELLIRLGAVE